MCIVKLAACFRCLQLSYHLSAATPNSKTCFGYALLDAGGGIGRDAFTLPAKLRWPILIVHRLPPGVETHEQPLGAGGGTRRLCCNEGRRRFSPLVLSHCSFSSPRTRLASNGFKVRNTSSSIVTKIAFLDTILF